jgi:hypothetical protein
LIPISEKFSQQSINEFNWEKTLKTIELQLPVLPTAVKSALAPRKAFSKLATSLTKAVFAALLLFNKILKAV